MWPEKVKASVEITTYCNAKCPQCSRTNAKYDRDGPKDLKKVEWLPLNHWSFKEFKTMFNAKTLSKLFSVQFSGTFGDPGMNPDLIDMVKYLDENNIRTTINTNGSMQDENFWFLLAGYATNIVFDIDGTTQEMHAKYRRNTNLAKVLRNMQAAIDVGMANIQVFTVIFKHNEDYLDDIKKMVMDMGIEEKYFLAMESSRFHLKPYQDFYNEKGELERLEQTTNVKAFRDRDVLTRKVRDHKDAERIDNFSHIECSSVATKNLHISNTGLVFPCCFLAYPYERIFYSGTVEPMLDHPLIRYIKDKEFLFNLKYHSLDEIMSNEWYSKLLEDSFTSNPIFSCKKMCGKCK